jgi:peptide deformylase
MRIILPHGENPALRETSREIPLADISTSRIQELIREMKQLLSKEEYGVALAACQVGEPLRLFIVSGRALLRQAQDKSPRHPREDYEEVAPPLVVSEVEPDQVYINPVMTKISRGKTGKHEGCLSIRGKWGVVPRSEKASIAAYDENGTKFTRGASGFLAHIFQHEMDHLDGILYTDKATELYDDKQDEPASDD